MANGGFSLGNAEESRIDAVMQIAEACGLAPWPRDDYLAEIDRGDSIFLLLKASGDECAGFAVGRPVAGGGVTEAELYNIGIDPRFRALGGGMMLLQAFLEECKKRGAKAVWLEVRASNKSAIRLYERAGFIQTAVRRLFYRNPVEDAIIMKKEL